MTTQGVLALLCVQLLVTQGAYPFPDPQSPAAPQAPGGATQNQAAALVPDQLDSLVAPVALYPDPILSQVLVAATYPLEIVEAARWLGANSTLQGKALVDAAAKQTWDASVQALVMFPDLLKLLNKDIGWTSDLGNAFLAQQQEVLDAVQRMRQKAQNKGALQSNEKQTVSTATEGGNTYIQIEPASPEVVYIPQYDPSAIWGPPPYYPYPPVYYPSAGAVFTAGAIAFGVGVAVGAIWSGGWRGWGWNAGWGNHNVVINNNFISRNNFNRVNIAGNGNTWVHNPAHRGGVPYNNRNVADRYTTGRGNIANTRPNPAQIQQGLNKANLAQRPGNVNPGQRPGNGAGVNPGQGNLGQSGNAFRPGQANAGQAGRAAQGQVGQGNFKPSGGDRVGNRNIGGATGGGAFGGINQGGNRAVMNSNRGFSSGGFRGGGGSRGGGGRRR